MLGGAPNGFGLFLMQPGIWQAGTLIAFLRTSPSTMLSNQVKEGFKLLLYLSSVAIMVELSNQPRRTPQCRESYLIDLTNAE